MKSPRIVKIFGIFLGLVITGLTIFILMEPSFFMDTQDMSEEKAQVGKISLLLNTQQQQGQKYFQTYCATCHGLLGEGNGPTALNFTKPPPNFLIQQQEFKNGFKTAALYKTLNEGIPNTPMPSFSYLSQDIKNSLVEYLQVLRPQAP